MMLIPTKVVPITYWSVIFRNKPNWQDVALHSSHNHVDNELEMIKLCAKADTNVDFVY
jgi:hypothetical protein